MKVVILAAGRGKRLGKLTENIPKCMLEFGETTILERQISILNLLGIPSDCIYVVCGYKADAARKINDVHIVENTEYKITDNSYSLWLGLQYIDDDVLVLDGDLVFELSALQEILKLNTNSLLAISEDNIYGNTGIILKDKYASEIGKHISTSPVYTGIMLLKKEILHEFRETLKYDKAAWYTIPLNRFIKNNLFRVCITNAKIYGINTYSEYIEAKRIFGIDQYIIWVTGATGFLGSKVYHILKRNYKVTGTGNSFGSKEFSSIDLTDYSSVEAFINLNKPNVIVNTAGIPEPEKCDIDQKKALEINVDAVKNLVKLSRKYGIKLIQISTDYVFDGDLGQEYEKDSVRNPKNFYGITKKMAEDIVMEYFESLIVRIPVLYGYNNENDKLTFPLKVIKSLSQGKELYLDNKQIRYPVLIDEVAFVIGKSLAKHGVIHITSDIPVTKYQWASIIADIYNLDKKLLHIDENSALLNRPNHIKMKTESNDNSISDIYKGTLIMKNQMNCVFKLIYKSSPAEQAYGKNVGNYRYHMGKELGKTIPQSIVLGLDYIVPVPSSGLFYAMGVAEQTGVPYMQALQKPDTSARSFQISDIGLREQLILDKIIPIPELLDGKSIMLVDEAIFTGTTLKVICDIVKACGVRKIYIGIPTPVCRNMCMQYVQPERRLLSDEMESEREIADYFKAEQIFFQKYETFLHSFQDINHICFHCFADDRE